MNQLSIPNFLNTRHPISWVLQVLHGAINNNLISNGTALFFSKYRYIPQSFIDDRSIFTLPLWQLTADKSYLNNASSLDYNEELAFHSQLFDFGVNYHLPLIDFGNVDRGIIDSSPLRDLAAHWGISFRIYNSGRSFHAYGDRLIKENEWVKFMGSLLLLNKPSGFKLIDERWVGHRIMAGYSALRWSCNTSHYKKSPVSIGLLNSHGLFMDYNNKDDF